MESQHMTQQVFADYIGLAPATLSGIFNDRTRPTLNVVESIKKKIPNISTDWLMFGIEPMFLSPGSSATTQSEDNQHPNSTLFPDSLGGGSIQEASLDFGQPVPSTSQNAISAAPRFNGVNGTHHEFLREEVKFVDKPQRRVTEIRVYYDDQTWESFVPSKK